MKTNINRKKKVLIVYQYIALYRKPIFEHLSNSDNLDVSFACDIESKGNIKLVNQKFFENKQFVKLKNYWLKNFLWQQGLINQILFGKYDVIIFLADPHFLSTWIASIIAKIKGQKVVFWTHGFIRNKSFKNRLKLLFYKLTDIILLYGEKAKSNLIHYKINKNKLFCIYNSLDYNLQKKIRESTNINLFNKYSLFQNPKLKQIVFIGRLTPQKQLEKLIELVIELEKRGLKVNLLFIGDGEEKIKLEKTAFEKNNLMGRIKFYGKTYKEEEIAPLIMCSDVCISPGEIGLTAMHVLSYGIPIITHNDEFSQMPEYEAVIEGFTGKLFEKGSFPSMLETTIDFFNNPIKNIHTNCIKTIENKYTPHVQRNLLENAINSLYKND